ncbi:MAG: cysteine desulfurase [Clostridium sp.]|nr:cysteine desulfurase [Clostridium sp.]MCM1444582.1 cysteine desulfurase [Candidatus Amulumruptor caecigallinarius]
MNREDFPMLNEGLIYFDNAATTLKPKVLLNALNDYYYKYCSNAHRGDYDISLKTDKMYENTREIVRKFIGAEKQEEIIFTSGCTDSLNRIIFGYCKYILKQNDEVIISKSEHASNVLPWFELKEIVGIDVKYAPLNEKYELTLENIKNSITEKTKVISIAHITNVVGDIRPLKEIIEYAHERGILVIVDGAQSVPHIKIDVKDLDIDFLAFSSHKICGPTGVGILYGKELLLNNMKPLLFGGGMNASFDNNGVRMYKDLPYTFEAGTPNIADVIAFGSVIEYINSIGMEKIHNYEKELKKYAISRLKEVKNIIIYNEESENGIISFNLKDIFSQDLAIYLNRYKICVRAGNHCAKILKDELGVKNTCRASFYFYNTKEEIDLLVEALKNPNLLSEII